MISDELRSFLRKKTAILKILWLALSAANIAARDGLA